MQHICLCVLAAMPKLSGAPVLFDSHMMAGIHTGLICHEDSTHLALDNEVSSVIVEDCILLG